MDKGRTASSSTTEPDEPARDLPSVLIDVNETLRQELEEETKSLQQSSSSGPENGEPSKSISLNDPTDVDKDAGAVNINQNMHTHQPQENLRDTVFLRAEAIPENQMKVSPWSQNQRLPSSLTSRLLDAF